MVETYLRLNASNIELDRKTITNIRFYVPALYAVRLVGSQEHMVKKISELPSVNNDEILLSDVVEAVVNIYLHLGGTDQVAKGPTLTQQLFRQKRSDVRSLDLHYFIYNEYSSQINDTLIYRSC